MSSEIPVSPFQFNEMILKTNKSTFYMCDIIFLRDNNRTLLFTEGSIQCRRFSWFNNILVNISSTILRIAWLVWLIWIIVTYFQNLLRQSQARLAERNIRTNAIQRIEDQLLLMYMTFAIFDFIQKTCFRIGLLTLLAVQPDKRGGPGFPEFSE